MLKRLKLPDQPRLDLLAALARWSVRPSIALIGVRQGHELLALAWGLRRVAKERAVYGARELLCLHWGTGLAGAQRLVRRADRLHASRCPLARLVRYAEAREDRSGWRDEVGKQVAVGAPALGMVCHVGVGTAADIQGDLAVLTALLDDETLVVLCRTYQRGPREQVDRMLGRFWGGVEIEDLALLKARRQ